MIKTVLMSGELVAAYEMRDEEEEGRLHMEQRSRNGEAVHSIKNMSFDTQNTLGMRVQKGACWTERALATLLAVVSVPGMEEGKRDWQGMARNISHRTVLARRVILMQYKQAGEVKGFGLVLM